MWPDELSRRKLRRTPRRGFRRSPRRTKKKLPTNLPTNTARRTNVCIFTHICSSGVFVGSLVGSFFFVRRASSFCTFVLHLRFELRREPRRGGVGKLRASTRAVALQLQTSGSFVPSFPDRTLGGALRFVMFPIPGIQSCWTPGV